MTHQTSFPEPEYSEERFTDLKCAEAEIRGKDFYDCTFVNCDFREATFYDCKFDECTFEQCELSLLTVTNSVFVNVPIPDVSGHRHRLDRGRLVQNQHRGAAQFLQERHQPLVFYGHDAQKSSFQKCVAENVDFAEADLSESDCTHTNFLSARFNETNLTKANFEDAINYAIDVNQNMLKKTRFAMPEAVRLLDGLDIVLKE